MIEGGRELPEELEQMAPGPDLAVLLTSVDRCGLSGSDRVRLARARNRLASHVNAELLSDLYAVTWDEPPADPSVPAEAGQYPWAEAEVAYALGWTAMATGRRMEQARQLVEELPQVLEALRAGLVDMPKALVIGELAAWLDDRDLARSVVDRIIDRASQLTTGQLRARLRRLVLAVDPQAARRRCATAVKTRRVEVFDNPEGSGELWGRSLPPQDTAAVWERLTAIARAAKSAGDPRSMDQLRADALLDLLAGEGVAVGGPITAHTAGLPEVDPQDSSPTDPVDGGTADGDCDRRESDRRESDRREPSRREPAASGDRADAGLDGAAGVTGAAVGWDPQWPAEPPPEQIAAHHVHPDPAGEPVDRWDEAGRAYDGPDLWPSDWPGRWLRDPAVAAAAGTRSTTMNPTPTDAAAPTDAESSATGTAPAVLPGPRRGVVELQVPLSTLLRLSDHPGDLVGFGPVVADIARQVAEQQQRQGATWRFSVYDKLGELAHHGITHQRPTTPTTTPTPATTGEAAATGRRPAAQVAAFVRARDRTCVAPGCRRSANGCDLDHTIDWAHGGHSDTANLGPLCRRHHRFKHASGTDLIQFTPGTFGWTTPRGMQYVTKPEPPLVDDAELVGRCPPGSAVVYGERSADGQGPRSR